MITINITEETNSKAEMAELLRHIANMLIEDYTSGYAPAWEIEGEEE